MAADEALESIIIEKNAYRKIYLLLNEEKSHLEDSIIFTRCTMNGVNSSISFKNFKNCSIQQKEIVLLF